MALSRICKSSELITVLRNGSSYTALAYLRRSGSSVTRRYSIAENSRPPTFKPVDPPGSPPKANASQGSPAAAAAESGSSASVVASSSSARPNRPELSKRDKLKIVVRDYGRTVIVFHVGISLLSLGIFYTIVSRGLDISPYVNFISTPLGPADEDSKKLVNSIMSEGSTFLIAYAVHKLFAPIRIGITLGFTPMLVKFLRRKGILKPPKKVVVG